MSCWPRPRTARRAGPPPTSKAGSRRCPRRSHPRGTSRPDWMIAAELAELLGGDLGVSSVDDLTDAIAANVAGFGEATVAALRSARDGIVCKGSLPAATAKIRRPSRSATATTTASSSAASCTTTRSARPCRLRWLIWRPDRELHLHPLDIERVGSHRRRRCQGHQQARFDGVQGRRRRHRRSWLRVGAVQPTGAEHRRADRFCRRRSPTAGGVLLMLALRSAARSVT